MCVSSKEVPQAFVCLTLVALVPSRCWGTKTVVSPVTKAASLSVSLCLSSSSSLFSHTLHAGWWMESGCEMGSEQAQPPCLWPLASIQTAHDFNKRIYSCSSIYSRKVVWANSLVVVGCCCFFCCYLFLWILSVLVAQVLRFLSLEICVSSPIL